MWHKEALLKVLSRDCNPWEIEINQNSYGYEYYSNCGDNIIDWGYTTWHPAGLYKGKWCYEVVNFFEKEGIKMDYKKRGFANLTLSIITPYYKCLEETKRLAEVLVPQLTDEVEWIIVDDGCNEKELDNINARIIHLEENSGGASKPRNVGLDNACGDYIAFIDADDLVSNNYIEEILNKIKNDTFDYCYIGWKSSRWEITGEPPEWNCAVWCRIYKRTLIGDNRFNTFMVIAEDKDFNDRVISGVKACITEYLYFYNDQMECSLTKRRGKKIHKNAFCFSIINAVGGAETYLYYMAKKYKDWDVCIYYQEGDPAQIARLKKYFRVQKWEGEEIFCDKMFYNYDPMSYIEHVHAKEHIQVVHTDYLKMRIEPCTHPNITGYIGVTQHICDVMEKNFGIKCKLSYNPLEVDYVDDDRKVLKLVSATRLSYAKGKERIEKMCEMLDKENIPYVWTIFTNDEDTIAHPGVYIVKCNIDIMRFVKMADYLVQLSDNVEGYGYSIAEALTLGVPVICTDVDAFKEIGVKDGENAFVCDFDLHDLNVRKIYKTKLEFEYKAPKDGYDKIFAKGKSQYMEGFEKKVEVEAIINPYFYDIELKENKEYGERYVVSRNRAEDLIEKGLVQYVRDVEEKKVKKRASRRVS